VNWITPGAEREWQRARVMWPFRTRRPIRQSDARATIDDAIRFTAHRWCAFSRSIALPPETNLRDRIGIFARSLDASLHGRFPSLAAAPDQAIVVRTCGLYGMSGARSKGGNFVDGRVADARAGRTIEMACEQVISPTSTADLSRAVFELIANPGAGPGIYHLVNDGACSWYQFTCEIVRLIGAPVEVVPVDRGGRSGEMRRPLYSALANTRARALGIVLRPWQDAVAAYLQAKYPEIT